MLKPIEKIKDKERKERRNKIVLGLLSAFIMIISVIGFALNLRGGNSNVKEGGFWNFYVKLGNQKLQLKTLFLPNETGDVKIKYAPTIGDFINKKYYFYSSSELREESFRALSYLSYISILREACLKDYPCYNSELPLKDCNENFIVFIKSNDTEIDRKSECIILKGNRTNIDKTIDKFLYIIFKIEK